LRLLKLLLPAFFLWVAVVSYEQGSEKETTNETGYYVAILDSTMTISEITKANQIGEPYLGTKLKMPTKAASTLPLHKLKKSFKFTDETLKQVIEEAKNRN